MSNTNAHKPGYKHTALGWIPDEWNVEKVGDLCDFIVPGRNKPSFFAGDIPWVTTPDIESYKIIHASRSDLFVSREEAKKIGSKIVPTNSVIMSCVGELGLVAITGNEVVINQQLHAFIPKSRIYGHFLMYALKFQQKYIESVATKTAVPYLNKDNCNSIPVFLPPMHEQQKIAIILSAWDEAIQKTQQLIEQLKQRNKGLMQQLLKPHKNWRQYKLSDIFERVTQKNNKGNTNVVTISAQRGFVRQDDFFNKLVASDVLDNYFLVERGDFCYNKSYSKGYDWGATKRLKDFDKAVVTTLYICFRIKDISEHSVEFFEYFFESGILNKGLSKIAHEGGRAHGLLNVTPGDFFSLKVSLPNRVEQDRIYFILQGAENELKLYEQQLTTLQEQKKGLMQKLLSGEVRVK